MVQDRSVLTISMVPNMNRRVVRPLGVAVAAIATAMFSATLPLPGQAKPLMESRTNAIAQTPGSRVLNVGDRGSDVVALQLRLRDLGYFTQEATGFFGFTTENALSRFQEDYGLFPDGVAGENTWDLLVVESAAPPRDRVRFPPNSWLYFENPVLVLGDRGAFVRTLQSALNEVGFGPIGEDGVYGSRTADAVAEFQRLYNIPGVVPGEVDEQTAEVLQKVLEGSVGIVGLPYAYDIELEDRGFDVYELQRGLSQTPRPDGLGMYYTGPITGRYDFATDRAVRDFQRDSGIDATGVVRESTFARLFADYNYVVVVPFSGRSVSGSDIERVRDVIERVDSLFDLNPQQLRFYDDRRGPYIDVGWYRTAEAARERAQLLQNNGLSSARVTYFEDLFARPRLSRAELEAKY